MQGEQRKAGSPDASQASWNSLLSLAKTSYSPPERKQLRKSHPLAARSKQIRSNTVVGRNGRLSGLLGSDSQESAGRKKNSKPRTAGDWRPRHWLVLTYGGDRCFPLLIGIAGSSTATSHNQTKTKQKEKPRHKPSLLCSPGKTDRSDQRKTS